VFDGCVAAMAAGYEPDIQSMWKYLNQVTQEHHLLFGTTPAIEYYTSKLSVWLTRGLYPSGMLPSSCGSRINGNICILNCHTVLFIAI
jgi:20S proteasome alpha/beta subunit